MSPNIIHQASDLDGDEDFLISSLRAAKLLRSVGEDYGVELYHDRIREALASSLQAESVRQIHRRLVQTLLLKGLDDPETLFEHYLGAGEPEQALRYAALAGKKVAEALAFDRAALFYRRALQLGRSVRREPRQNGEQSWRTHWRMLDLPLRPPSIISKQLATWTRPAHLICNEKRPNNS